MELAPESSTDDEVKVKSYWQEQINWLKERFPEGKYCDVIGLCKVVKINDEDGIKDQDYSLNVARYVGVVIEDDGLTKEAFKDEIKKMNEEFEDLSRETKKLEELIKLNFYKIIEG